MDPKQKLSQYVGLDEHISTEGMTEGQLAAVDERNNLRRLPLEALQLQNVKVSHPIRARWHPGDVFAVSGSSTDACPIVADVKCRKEPSTKYPDWFVDTSKVDGIRRWRDDLPHAKRSSARVMMINFFIDDWAFFWDLDQPPLRQEWKLLPHKDGDGPWRLKRKQVNFYHVDNAMKVKL